MQQATLMIGRQDRHGKLLARSTVLAAVQEVFPYFTAAESYGYSEGIDAEPGLVILVATERTVADICARVQAITTALDMTGIVLTITTVKGGFIGPLDGTSTYF